MNGFEPIVSVTTVVIGILLLLIIVLCVYGRCRDVVRGPYLIWLMVARSGGIALLALLFLQPFRLTEEPDREQFQVVVLADCSVSMKVADCRGQTTRLAHLTSALDDAAEDSFITRLKDRYQVRVLLFSDRIRPRTGAVLDTLPGRSALGNALAESRDSFSSVPPGAVLLLSDGRTNHGVSPTQIAKTLLREQIPVSTVGFGEPRHGGDVRVRFPTDRLTATKGKPFNLGVTVESTFRKPINTMLVLSSNGVEVERTSVSLPETGSVEVHFTDTPYRAGFQTYRAEVEPVPEDMRTENDLDFAGVSITEPAVFSVLYLGDHLDWEYKYLRIVAQTDPQLNLAAVIRTGSDSYYTAGLTDVPEKIDFGLSSDQLNKFDAIVLGTRVFQETPAGAALAEKLQRFVADRGGGMLVVGPVTGLPDAVCRLLPVTAVETTNPTSREMARTNDTFIFEHDPAHALVAAPGPFIPARDPVVLASAAQLKKGARAAMTVRDDEKTVLAAQSYGSGRAAYFGTESTWRWRLASSSGRDCHEHFWRTLLVWLASTSKPRVTADGEGAKVSVGDELALAVDVLGSDFRPALDARVRALVVTPNGPSPELALDPSGTAGGRYSVPFVPCDAGEYEVLYSVHLPDETLTYTAPFLARHTSVEARDTDYREDVLRDVARITGGRFWSYDQINAATDIPVSARVPLKVERWYWTETPLVLVLCLLCFAADWYGRRRIGLR